MRNDDKGKLTAPSKDLNEVDSALETCKNWDVTLLNVDGEPVTRKGYTISAPVKDHGALSSEGRTSLYNPPLPAKHEEIKVLFALKLLPNIKGIFDNYPNVILSVPGTKDPSALIGGEYRDTYVRSHDEYDKAKIPFGRSPYYNTCVARTSIAFNESAHEDAPYTVPRDPNGRGHGIPRRTLPSGTLHRLKGAKVWPDGSSYAYALRVHEFERYMNYSYPDAPKLKGKGLDDFRGKDGVITFNNDHFDVIKDDKIRYNWQALRGHHDVRDVDGTGPIIPWKDGEVRLWQYVIIKPKRRMVTKGVCTFVFQMESR